MSPIEEIWNYEELLHHVGLPPEGARSLESLLPGTPPEFLEIIQYAAVWGIGDDIYRSELVAGATEVARHNLKRIVAQREDQLDEWLAGPESEAQEFSEAYVAFSCMRMASDEVSADPQHS